MALIDAALTTLSDVETELGDTSPADAYIQRLINAVSEQIAAYCGRTFYYEEAIEEDVPGYGNTLIHVSRTPLLSIDSITFEGSTVDSDDYSIYSADAGSIFTSYGWYWTACSNTSPAPIGLVGTEDKDYTVTYDGGYVTPQQAADDENLTRSLPYDLEDACIREVVTRYRNKARDLSVTSEKLGSAAVSYRDASGSAGFWSPGVKEVLDKYRRIKIA